MPRTAVLATFAVAAFAITFGVTRLWKTAAPPSSPPPSGNPPGVVWIPGGEFTMGTVSNLGLPDEKPAHRVRVDGFWADETEVTNAQFRAFVEATNYVTTAEKPPDVAEILKQS